MRPPPRAIDCPPLAVIFTFTGLSLVCLLASALWVIAAEAGTGAKDQPRLILPGNRVVRAGQLIDLHWAPTDSVSELEILISLDGGRHYSLCISPRLDPTSCHYLWRVPNLGDTPLSMRIRFNRG